MKYSFLNRSHPVITGLLAAETPQEFIARARSMEYDGAGAIAIELNHLKPEFRNHDSLKSVIDAVNLPFMTISTNGASPVTTNVRNCCSPQ